MAPATRPAEVGGVAKDGRETFPPPPTSGREIVATLVATVHVQLAPWKAACVFTNTGTPVSHDTRHARGYVRAYVAVW